MSDFQVLESLTPQLTVALENVTFLEEVSMLSVNFEGTDRILNKVTQRIIKIWISSEILLLGFYH